MRRVGGSHAGGVRVVLTVRLSEDMDEPSHATCVCGRRAPVQGSRGVRGEPPVDPVIEAMAHAIGDVLGGMGQVIDQDGNEQVWKAHYMRYHSEEWEEFDSPEDAIAFLNYGEDSGNLSSIGVVWPDGTEREYDWVHDPDGVKMRGEGDMTAPARTTP